MSHQAKTGPGGTHQSRSDKINDVLDGIRVPDLPYPAGKVTQDAASDWRPLLLSCWNEQRDERVTHVIRSVHLDWSAEQVNAAYLADRIMDLFLQTSGLHPSLAGRIARLRFYLAWRMNLEGAGAFTPSLTEWLDSLQEWRGWSDSGGRSAKALLDQLDALVIAVSASFESGSSEPVEAFCEKWQSDSRKRATQEAMLRRRLLEKEQGVARQYRAEQTARALIGRALKGRHLPPAIIEFIFNRWQGLLKQAVLEYGLESDSFRHGSKLLEWLVWVGDPSLSDKDRNRLYHVGEQIGDRLLDVWRRVYSTEFPAGDLTGIEQVMMSRLKGETPELESALPPPDSFPWNPEFLEPPTEITDAILEAEGKWYVEGEGHNEQRRYFYAFLQDSGNILWTNGGGVKFGLQPWSDFQSAKSRGDIRSLPQLTPFGDVLADTVNVLSAVALKQRQQRELAARKAREKAEALRQERQAAEEARRKEEAAREAELKRQREEAEARRLADEKAELERLEKENLLVAQQKVDGIKLGGWISVEPDDDRDEPLRMKLAVRINASRKLIFVDRLGLNRQEYQEKDLVSGIVDKRIRVLGSTAEFDDTLSRVVGRIRVGRS
ncbi:MAG: DUF1631 family protein [Gammaproteobacteria bacterium]|nr:MAG: DUF1631 family protein [Gammaproteobacteria bacterium]